MADTEYEGPLRELIGFEVTGRDGARGRVDDATGDFGPYLLVVRVADENVVIPADAITAVDPEARQVRVTPRDI
ncbi:hypothetical protein Lfu02_09530 [Longispora fulva]|uniref:PRC-barrel domain-containing protein n=1 Tax=Longispora fulva TaxID=619741 RepID=A0A8J7KGQ8_9ACTN|nr:hypothetical protein [Longispora fulva]MBG6135184.1 hypothetical protein [Longispora fulva]GIG56581.1 hypothetical protein Lfu02_09530 [Longispora fulva]